MKGTGKTKIGKGNIAIMVIIAIIFIIAFSVIDLSEKTGIRAVAQIELASEYVQKVESVQKAAVEALAKRDVEIKTMQHQDSLKDAVLEKERQQKKLLQSQIRNRDEKIDSLHAVIRSIRQSDI